MLDDDDDAAAGVGVCWDWLVLCCIIMPSVARLVSNEGEGDEGGRAVFSIVVDDTRANLTWTVKSPRPVSSAQRS